MEPPTQPRYTPEQNHLKKAYKRTASEYVTKAKVYLATFPPGYLTNNIRITASKLVHPASNAVRVQTLGWAIAELAQRQDSPALNDVGNAFMDIGEYCHPYGHAPRAGDLRRLKEHLKRLDQYTTAT